MPANQPIPSLQFILGHQTTKAHLTTPANQLIPNHQFTMDHQIIQDTLLIPVNKRIPSHQLTKDHQTTRAHLILAADLPTQVHHLTQMILFTVLTQSGLLRAYVSIRNRNYNAVCDTDLLTNILKADLTVVFLLKLNGHLIVTSKNYL